MSLGCIQRCILSLGQPREPPSKIYILDIFYIYITFLSWLSLDSRVSAGQVTRLEALVKEQGDKVREMKTIKASKEDVTAAVAILKQRKADVEAAKKGGDAGASSLYIS